MTSCVLNKCDLSNCGMPHAGSQRSHGVERVHYLPQEIPHFAAGLKETKTLQRGCVYFKVKVYLCPKIFLIFVGGVTRPRISK